LPWYFFRKLTSGGSNCDYSKDAEILVKMDLSQMAITDVVPITTAQTLGTFAPPQNFKFDFGRSP
jgi:hypothetical protein